MYEFEHTTTFRDKDGGVQIIISWKDSLGKWHQKSKQGFASRKEAKAYENKLLEMIQDLPAPIDSSMAGITLEDFTEIFIQDNTASLEPGTLIQYRLAAKLAVPLSKMPVQKITHADVVACVRGWNYKPHTQRQFIANLRKVMNYAIDPYQLIKDNPFSCVKVGKRNEEAKEIIAFSELELKRILQAAQKKSLFHYALLSLAAYTGMRYGELYGLRWKDVDLKKAEITVRQQFAVTGVNQYGLKSLKTKNGQNRCIPIPAKLVRVLRQYKMAYPIDISGRLFVKHYRGMKSSQLIKAVVPSATMHTFRHTYATRLISQGVDVATVAALMGDKIETINKYYVHYNDDMRAAARKNIEKIFA